jgi:SAM-dependent methyltransferase
MCTGCGALYRRERGVWRLLAAERAPAFERFIREYETVRQAEGRGSDDDAYYRALPFADLTGSFAEDWRIRARSFEALLRHVVAPLERRGPLRALDLGAGCCWLAYRLAQRGHAALAADLQTDERDGLGAHVRYDAPLLAVQAEFERLPLAGEQLDLVVINAALHYATDYVAALGEALRVLRPGGALAIVDTPVYHDPSSGARMLRERGDEFERRFGFRGDALPCEGYLSYRRLGELAAELGVRWRIFRPRHGVRWALRPLVARLRGRREPAAFPLIVAYRGEHNA